MSRVQKPELDTNLLWKKYAPYAGIGLVMAGFSYLITRLGSVMFTHLLVSSSGASDSMPNSSLIVVSVVYQAVTILLGITIARSLYKAISDPRPLAMSLVLASLIMVLVTIVPFILLGYANHFIWLFMQLGAGAAAGVLAVLVASRIKNTKILYVLPALFIAGAYIAMSVVVSVMFKDS
jgi:hypothetical protein